MSVKETIGGYVVLKDDESDLGTGVSGSVYMAKHATSGKVVAAKRMKLSQDPDHGEKHNRKYVFNELKILKTLNHRNVIKLYNSEKKGKYIYLFLELCEKGDLNKFIEKERVLSREVAFRFLVHISEALVYLHGHEPVIIHRDVKPDNLLVQGDDDQNYVIKITDFAFSKQDPNAAVSTLLGTQNWIAPEVRPDKDGRVSYSIEADVFSAGLVFLAILDHEAGKFFIAFKVGGQALGDWMNVNQVAATEKPLPAIVKRSDDGPVVNAKGTILHMLSADPSDRCTMRQVRDSISIVYDAVVAQSGVTPREPSVLASSSQPSPAPVTKKIGSGSGSGAAGPMGSGGMGGGRTPGAVKQAESSGATGAGGKHTPHPHHPTTAAAPSDPFSRPPITTTPDDPYVRRRFESRPTMARDSDSKGALHKLEKLQREAPEKECPALVVIMNPDLLKYIREIMAKELAGIAKKYHVKVSSNILDSHGEFVLKGENAAQAEKEIEKIAEMFQENLFIHDVYVNTYVSGAEVDSLKEEFKTGAVIEYYKTRSHFHIIDGKSFAHSIKDELKKKLRSKPSSGSGAGAAGIVGSGGMGRSPGPRCQGCIDSAFSHKSVCPICGKVFGVLQGTQPPHGKMKDRTDYGRELPGYPGVGTIVIDYEITDGFQGPEHPEPGQRYKGTRRTAFLPDNAEGRQLLRLLRRAFDQRLTFTVGRSTTFGREDAVTWNDIHHKTNVSGGPARFGYPDPTYLQRVKEELAAKGITEDM